MRSFISALYQKMLLERKVLAAMSRCLFVWPYHFGQAFKVALYRNFDHQLERALQDHPWTNNSSSIEHMMACAV